MHSPSHAFDPDLAKELGVEKAIIIWHLQFWIRFNRNRGKNIRDGKCWTYQSMPDMQAYMPYFSYDSIRYHIDGLKESGILIVANYNRAKFDKTLWYAFADEKKFKVSAEDSNNSYERGKPHTSGENPTRGGENPRPIPDTKEEDTQKEGIREESRMSKRVKKPKAPPSAEAEEFSAYFLSRIREEKKDFNPPGLRNWPSQVDEMLKEGRKIEKAREIIDWIAESDDGFAYMQCPNKLMDKFDEQEMRMEADKKKKMAAKTKEKINRNRDHFLWMQAQYPARFKKLAFDQISVKNLNTGYGLTLDSDPIEFEQDLLKLFPEVPNGRNV